MRSQEEFSNSGKVRLQDFNWNRNQKIKQQLKVFQTTPDLGQKLNLDPSNFDPTLKRLFKELGISEGPNISSSVRPK